MYNKRTSSNILYAAETALARIKIEIVAKISSS